LFVVVVVVVTVHYVCCSSFRFVVLLGFLVGLHGSSIPLFLFWTRFLLLFVCSIYSLVVGWFVVLRLVCSFGSFRFVVVPVGSTWFGSPVRLLVVVGSSWFGLLHVMPFGCFCIVCSFTVGYVLDGFHTGSVPLLLSLSFLLFWFGSILVTFTFGHCWVLPAGWLFGFCPLPFTGSWLFVLCSV